VRCINGARHALWYAGCALCRSTRLLPLLVWSLGGLLSTLDEFDVGIVTTSRLGSICLYALRPCSWWGGSLYCGPWSVVLCSTTLPVACRFRTDWCNRRRIFSLLIGFVRSYQYHAYVPANYPESSYGQALLTLRMLNKRCQCPSGWSPQWLVGIYCTPKKADKQSGYRESI
jgi:hypothetical protein